MPFFFFFNDTATTEIYTLSLHDALPIYQAGMEPKRVEQALRYYDDFFRTINDRSEEHTSELQSQSNLVCRLLLEKKKKKHQSDDHQHKTTTTPPARPPTCPNSSARHMQT